MAAHLNSGTVQNFSVLDGIDATNITYGGSTTLGFSEDASNTFGTLTVSDGSHTAAITLLGQYTTASFQTISDGGSGTLVALASTTHLSDILAAAQAWQETRPSHPLHSGEARCALSDRELQKETMAILQI